MAQDDRPDVEPEAGPPSPLVPSPKTRQSLTRVRRELDDAELASPAVQRLLIDEIERLERDNATLSAYRDRFHVADTRATVLEGRLKESLASEVTFAVVLTVGSAALGYAPSAWQSQPSGWLALVFGSVLIIGGVASRVVRR